MTSPFQLVRRELDLHPIAPLPRRHAELRTGPSRASCVAPRGRVREVPARPASRASMIAAGMSGELVADLVRRLVERLGGRWSRGLGIDVDEGDEEVDRWALAATLFGNRISAAIVERTYRVLAQAGVATIADAGERSWDELVELLDRGGHVRYDFRTASRLLALARAVAAEHGGRVASLREALRDPAELEAALDALPGCGGR